MLPGLKAGLMALAALTMAAGTTPAFAGGGGGFGYYGSFGHGAYGSGFRGNRGYYGGSRFSTGRGFRGRGFRGRGFQSRGFRGNGFRGNGRFRGRGRISAGEGALIAAGIIGGVILIDQAIQSDRRRFNDRYDAPRYDPRYDDRRRFENDDTFYRRDERNAGTFDRNDDARSAPEDLTAPDAQSPNDLDQRLLGGDEQQGAAYTIQAAFNECAAETRGAAGAGGLMVALPGEPTDVENLANGGVRLTTVFTAQNTRGRQWRRTMVCEADGGGVRFLEIA